MTKTALYFFITLVILSCTSPKQGEKNILETERAALEGTTNTLGHGAYAHSVYVWLKNPDSEADRTAFESAMKRFLHQLPYATTRHLGTPADTRRDIIDFSYTYSVLLTFETRSDLSKYDTDPAHLEFLESSSHLWKKVLVYDSVNLLEN